MRVLVCGGRHYDDRASVWRLDPAKVSLLIHGDAPGADTLARQWADFYQVPQMAFPADWDLYGRVAGPTRNAQMIAHGQPDCVVAFPGGKGTANMIFQARAAGVPVWMFASLLPGPAHNCTVRL